MKRLYFLIFSVACATNAFSQASNCTQVLRLIRSTYEQGRLHELPSQMKECLEGVGDKGFTQADKREAYRYLTLAYIYLEEPEEADKAMLKLLDTDPFFQINDAVDPAEFIALYNKFRHEPLYFLDVKIGINISQPVVSKYYNVGSTGGGKGTYGMSIGIHYSAAFEKSITKKLVAAPEIMYITRNFSYSNPQLAVADEDPNRPISSQDFAFTQSWLDFNALVHYKIKDTQNFKSFIGGGPGISYLLASNNQASTKLGNDFTVTGGSIIDTQSYNKLVYSVTVVAGVKVKFANLYAMADIRYQYGLTNAINSSVSTTSFVGNRTNSSIGFDYQGQYNDYKMNNFMINLGVSYPIFKPKKLVK